MAIRGDLVFTVADVEGGPVAAADLAASAPTDAWQTVTRGADPAQPIAACFCALRVRPVEGRGDRWLLCERSPTEVHKYYLLHLPPTATLHDLVVTLARSRWPIEQQYRELKSDLGLDHFEGRTYRGWTRHVVLTAMAFTFLQLERGRRGDDTVARGARAGSAKSSACSTSSTTDNCSGCATASAATLRSKVTR